MTTVLLSFHLLSQTSTTTSEASPSPESRTATPRAAEMSVTSRLQSLPPELLTTIVDYIPRPTDLKSLCLTSKALQDVATPPLYKAAVFDHATPNWPKTRCVSTRPKSSEMLTHRQLWPRLPLTQQSRISTCPHSEDCQEVILPEIRAKLLQASSPSSAATCPHCYVSYTILRYVI